MDEVEIRALFGRDPEWLATPDELSAGASSGRLLASAAWRRSKEIVEGLEAAADEVDADSTLSDEGKAVAKARRVADAGARLDRVRKHCESLAAELSAAEKAYTPREVDEVTASAIWSRLPADAMQVQGLYRSAIEAGDWRTLGAIEAMPVVFDGRLAPDEMAELKAERREHEAPDVAKAVAVSTSYVEAVDSALNAALSYVTNAGRDLPKPDPESSFARGTRSDGLRTLTPSGFQAAMAGGPKVSDS